MTCNKHWEARQVASWLASLTNKQALYSTRDNLLGGSIPLEDNSPPPAVQLPVVLWLRVGPCETPSSHVTMLIDRTITVVLLMHPFLGFLDYRLPGILALRLFQLSLSYWSLSHRGRSCDINVSIGGGFLMIHVQLWVCFFFNLIFIW